MNRSFYSFTLLVNLLIAVVALVDAVLYLLLGNRFMYLNQYPTWLLVKLFFTALQGVLMLRYFALKKYRSALWIGIPTYAIATFLTFINYATLVLAFGARIVIPVYILTLLLQAIYSITISVSMSKERAWLKYSGWYGLILCIVTLSLGIVVASGKFIEYHPSIEKFQGVILCAAVILPLTLVMNFWRELNAIEKEVTQAPDIFSNASPLLVMATFGFVMFMMVAGVDMKSELPKIDVAFQKVAEPFDPRVFVKDKGDSLNYRLLKPLDFDSTKRYPIVVCLHGSSGTGSDNYLQVAASLMPEFLTHGSNREKFRAFIFVPQCPFGTSWGGHPFPSIDKIVFEALASLESEFPVDSTRRYVTGISLGGYGTWHFITTHPGVFAAAIPICGSGDPALASNCVDVAVWAFHGALDERVPVSGSRNMIEAMKKSGGSPRYTEFPDTGHNIGRIVVDTPGLLDWMFDQRRD